MTQIEQGTLAWDIHQEIKKNEQMRRALFIENMKKLVKFRDEKLYREYLGDKEAQWTAYLSESDVFYSRWQIERWSRILNMAEKFNLEGLDLLEVPETRLEQIASMAIDAQNATELIEQAKVLTPKDWTNVINERKGLPTTDDGHEHKFKEFEICTVCGQKHVKEKETQQV